MLEALSASSASILNTAAKPTVLSYADASTVWLLSWSGKDNHSIATTMGTNAGRVADILAENTYVGSRANADRMRNARAAMIEASNLKPKA